MNSIFIFSDIYLDIKSCGGYLYLESTCIIFLCRIIHRTKHKRIIFSVNIRYREFTSALYEQHAILIFLFYLDSVHYVIYMYLIVPIAYTK